MRVRRTAGVFRADADRATLLRAARRLGAVGVVISHAFEPRGDSVAVVGDACRVVLLTWPEHALVTVDVYAAVEIELGVLTAELGWERLAEELPAGGGAE